MIARTTKMFSIFITVAAAFARAGSPTTLPYTESLRPQFHFTATKDWLNDPNGLIYYEGEYHLFFQRSIGRTKSDGNMSWGHAVSKDLIHWQELANALTPDDAGPIWSGSAVVDWQNTSGFGAGGKPPLVAMYTRAKSPFVQCIAWSIDRGRTWTKFTGNPVLPNVFGKNRDPKVIWHEPSRRWIVALYLGRPHEFGLFASSDLKQWMLLQTVTLDGDDECPDFFPIRLDGDAAKTKWVFTGAKAIYVIGDFDGVHFIPQTDAVSAECGPNFYATQTFSDLPGGRRVQIGWMRRSGEYPGMPFNQQLSFPSELTLRTTPAGPRLFRWPVKEIEKLYGDSQTWHTATLSDQPMLADLAGDLFDLEGDISIGQAKDITLSVRGYTIIFHAEPGGGALICSDRRVALRISDGHLRLRVLVDRASAEIFINGGSTVISCCFLPDDRAKPLTLTATGGLAVIEGITIHKLKSAWRRD